MKKIVITIALFTIAMMAGAQNTNKADKSYTREGDTFVQGARKARSSSSNDQVTAYTWRDSKGNEYPIVVHEYTRDTKSHKAGDVTCYVVKTSAKTGKEYKYYLPDGEKIAEEIINENL